MSPTTCVRRYQPVFGRWP
jgi:hypothetical protein